MTENPISRLARLHAAMEMQKIDLLALGPGPHMRWLLGFSPHADERPCLLLAGPGGEAFVMPALNAQGSREHTGIAFFEWSDDTGPNTALKEALAAVGGARAKSVALDETMRADFVLLLLGELPGASHQFAASTVGELRMGKDENEIDLLEASAEINDMAMRAGLAAIRPGISELEVAEVIKQAFLDNGASPIFTIVAGGPNGAFPHHFPGRRPLETGDAIVIDIGAKKDGFPSDMTRMGAVGAPPEGYAAVHAIVEAAVEAALAAARPGVRAMEVDAAARGVITEAGYGEFFVHRTGHGLGIEVHEPPYITATSQSVLKAGMVFSIEPGIYLPNRFGIRLEEIVVLRENGPHILSGLTRDLFVSKG
jgi:Xaa-Pro aminopeptidase